MRTFANVFPQLEADGIFTDEASRPPFSSLVLENYEALLHFYGNALTKFVENPQFTSIPVGTVTSGDIPVISRRYSEGALSVNVSS